VQPKGKRRRRRRSCLKNPSVTAAAPPSAGTEKERERKAKKWIPLRPLTTSTIIQAEGGGKISS
jgi:hypothetical protein